jgi:hypothetical protein
MMREFVVGELARLVEHFHRHQRLAQVVQQAGDAGFAGLLFVEAELAGQRDHQRADGHRVHVGVIVGGFQARQADQGAGVALTESEISSTSSCAPPVSTALPMRASWNIEVTACLDLATIFAARENSAAVDARDVSRTSWRAVASSASTCARRGVPSRSRRTP